MGDDSATEMLDKLLAEEGVPPADAAGGDEMSGDSQKLKNYADLMKKVPLLRSLTEEEQLPELSNTPLGPPRTVVSRVSRVAAPTKSIPGPPGPG